MSDYQVRMIRVEPENEDELKSLLTDGYEVKGFSSHWNPQHNASEGFILLIKRPKVEMPMGGYSLRPYPLG